MFTNWLTETSSLPIEAETNLIYPQYFHNQQNTPPPDTILEIGPPPFKRFAAHRTLLAAHSGYFRAEFFKFNGTTTLDSAIYIPNVTQEQFVPLLTYIYTGFLDLNNENIFAVLLATHILHMPRALEICRTFLARSQNESYLNSYFLPTSNLISLNSITPIKGSKIIRPIPSKAFIDTELKFISPPIINRILVPSQNTQFQHIKTITNRERSPIPSTSTILSQPESKLRKKNVKSKTKESSPSNIFPLDEYYKPNDSRNPTEFQNTSEDVPKNNETSSQHEELLKTENTNESKIIVDVASCDGPVRFRRVLNDSYGRVLSNITVTSNTSEEKRTNYSLNSSFHQQMARNITERNISEDSENSQETNQNNPKDYNDLYVCVYCKHTFKSQYCYQKHAKRHINPLTVENNDSSIDVGDEKNDEPLFDDSGENKIKSQSPIPVISSDIPQQNQNKREVRPLDMNVQYYPCKTCKCKFPSYYFVHKHRKMCHADEDNV